MSISTVNFGGFSSITATKPSRFTSLAHKSQVQNNSPGRRVWRRRKLAQTKKDEMQHYTMNRPPFLEERVRRIKEMGLHISVDIQRLLRSEDNRYAFVNEVAAEATEYVEKNKDMYGFEKKAVYHVLSNRMNEYADSNRSAAYENMDPYNRGSWLDWEPRS